MNFKIIDEIDKLPKGKFYNLGVDCLTRYIINREVPNSNWIAERNFLVYYDKSENWIKPIQVYSINFQPLEQTRPDYRARFEQALALLRELYSLSSIFSPEVIHDIINSTGWWIKNLEWTVKVLQFANRHNSQACDEQLILSFVKLLFDRSAFKVNLGEVVFTSTTMFAPEIQLRWGSISFRLKVSRYSSIKFLSCFLAPWKQEIERYTLRGILKC